MSLKIHVNPRAAFPPLGCYSGFVFSLLPGFVRLLNRRPLLVAALAFPCCRFRSPSRAARARSAGDALDGLHRHCQRQTVDVAHAAASYEFVSFDITGPVDVAITAAEAGLLGPRRRHPALAARPAPQRAKARPSASSSPAPGQALHLPARATFSTTPRCCFCLPARRLRPRRP